MRSVCALILSIVLILSTCGCSLVSHGAPGYEINSIEEFNKLMSQGDTNGYAANHNSSNEQLGSNSFLMNLGYPTINEGTPLEHFSYTYGFSNYICELSFWLNGLLYRFCYNKVEEEYDRSNMTVMETYQVGPRTIHFYQGTDCLVGEYYKDGYQVMIIVKGFSSLQDIDFNSFSWIEKESANHEAS